MLEHTFDRAERLISLEKIFAVVARSHLRQAEVRNQLSARPPRTIVVQPMNKETVPGLLLPLMHALLHYPNCTVAVFPSDHFVLQEDLFMAYVEQAFEMVERYPSKMVLLGAKPDAPEPEYGYVLPDNDELDFNSPFKRVKSFIEKPQPRIAVQLTALGALWNTMVMVFKPESLLHLVSIAAPMLHRSFQRIFRALETSRESIVIEEVYRHLQPMNFSKDLIESLNIHSRNQLYVIPMKDVLWSDWGSQARIVSVIKKLQSLDCLPRAFSIDDLRDRLPEVLTSVSAQILNPDYS